MNMLWIDQSLTFTGEPLVSSFVDVHVFVCEVHAASSPIFTVPWPQGDADQPDRLPEPKERPSVPGGAVGTPV